MPFEVPRERGEPAIGRESAHLRRCVGSGLRPEVLMLVSNRQAEELKKKKNRQAEALIEDIPAIYQLYLAFAEPSFARYGRPSTGAFSWYHLNPESWKRDQRVGRLER
jgi:hypothetical protein